MKAMKNNKGAALVSVLIATMFIVLLASSLIYMSYMNYLAKSMRYSSTDNFYTDEFALNELTCALQQTAAEAPNITAAYAAVRAAVGAHTEGTHTVYDPAAVAGLIDVAKNDAETISVNAAIPNIDTYIEDASAGNIKLVGVQLTAVTDAGFTSTITTDIVLTFPPTGPADLDINDFSVISDCPIQVNGGDVVFGGCVYMQGRNGTPALYAHGNSLVYVLSTKGIINGNIVIEGSAILSITGDVTVNGTITLRENAVLICTDDLSHEGIITEGNARVVGTTQLTGEVIDDTKLPGVDGLTHELFVPVYIRSQCSKIFNGYTLEFREARLSLFAADDKHWTMSTTDANGRQITVMINPAYPLNGPGAVGVDGGLVNTLCLNPDSMQIRGTLTNSTVLCGGRNTDGDLITDAKLIFEEGSMSTYLSRMDEADYELAKMILVSGQNPQFSNLSSIQNDFGYNFHNGLEGDLAKDDADEFSDQGSRTYLYKDQQNYLPIGYFIAENSSEIISNYFNQDNNSDPTNTYITYENWYKE